MHFFVCHQGYYTTRPFLKIAARRVDAELHTAGAFFAVARSLSLSGCQSGGETGLGWDIMGEKIELAKQVCMR